jgi:hypothetical protein
LSLSFPSTNRWLSGARKLLNVAGHSVEAVNIFEPDRLFSTFGFSTKYRVMFVDEVAPTNWNYEKFERLNIVLRPYTQGNSDAS